MESGNNMSSSALPLRSKVIDTMPEASTAPPERLFMSTYEPPVDVDYTSLQRSLAIAAAYAASHHPDGTVEAYHPPTGLYDDNPSRNYSLDPLDPDFYPVSAFSDWGSCRSSVASSTPTAACQFE